MYKGTPYINKHIKRRDQQRLMENHIEHLNHARPRTGTLDHDDVVINNKKRQMQKQDRFTEIQRQNRILLEKISSIMSKPKKNKLNESSKNMNRSLHSNFRKRQMQNIEIENAKLLKRLQDRKSDYQADKFKQSWKKQKYVIKNMSNYPFIISDRKPKRHSISAIAPSRQDASRKPLQLCRMRVIDGTSFLITVRLNRQSLQIIGDSKDKKQIKVIQIDRKQAIQFIEQQCNGKIELIFDRLRYDRVDQVLYLVGKDVDLQQLKQCQAVREQYKQKKTQNPEFDIAPNEEENEKINLNNWIQQKQTKNNEEPQDNQQQNNHKQNHQPQQDEQKQQLQKQQSGKKLQWVPKQQKQEQQHGQEDQDKKDKQQEENAEYQYDQFQKQGNSKVNENQLKKQEQQNQKSAKVQGQKSEQQLKVDEQKPQIQQAQQEARRDNEIKQSHDKQLEEKNQSEQ